MTPQELITAGAGKVTPLEAVELKPAAVSTPVIPSSENSDAKFDFAEFEKLKGTSSPIKNVEPTKIKETPAPEPAKEEPKEPVKEVAKEPEAPKEEEDDTPVTAKPILAKPPIEQQLKDEGLDTLSEELKPIFKQMGKPAREWAKARLKEMEDLKKVAQEKADGRLPANWYDHEEAYELHPEYKKAVNVANNANKFVGFWTEQFKRIKDGEKWENLIMDQKTGQISTQTMEPGAEAEVYVQRQIGIESDAATRYARQAEEIQSAFKQQRGNITSALQAAESRFFPQYTDPKSYEAPAKAVREMLAKFNQTGNVLGSFMTKLYAFAMEQDKTIKELQKAAELKQSKKEENLKAGPSYDELQGGKAKIITDPDEKPFDPKEFERLKAGR